MFLRLISYMFPVHLFVDVIRYLVKPGLYILIISRENFLFHYVDFTVRPTQRCVEFIRCTITSVGVTFVSSPLLEGFTSLGTCYRGSEMVKPVYVRLVFLLGGHGLANYQSKD